MNKTVTIIIHSLLFVAVAFLYYLHFSAGYEKISVSQTIDEPKESLPPIKMDLPQQINSTNIIYVNADSLFENYDYIKNLKKEANAKQANLESRYQEKGQKFQQDYMDYQQKASSGTITEEQARATEENLMKRKTELDEMEQQLNKLVEETQRKNALVQQEVTDFFKEYSKGKNLSYVLAYTSNAGSVLFANDSLDITSQLVDALNARYREKIKKK